MQNNEIKNWTKTGYRISNFPSIKSQKGCRYNILWLAKINVNTSYARSLSDMKGPHIFIINKLSLLIKSRHIKEWILYNK